MERHNTHTLSNSSSLENPYKFDKNGNMIIDSSSKVTYINKKSNKITTPELFKEIKKLNENLAKEELIQENYYNNNLSYIKNKLNANKNKNKILDSKYKKIIDDKKKLNNKFQIESMVQSFTYFPSINKNNIDKININQKNIINLNKNKENGKINNKMIKDKANFYSPTKTSKKDKTKEKNGIYEYKSKYSSKKNSSLSPINNKTKEKDIFIKNNNQIKNQNINDFYYMTNSSFIIKSKIESQYAMNNFFFYTKGQSKNELINSNQIQESRDSNKIGLKNKNRINNTKKGDNTYHSLNKSNNLKNRSYNKNDNNKSINNTQLKNNIIKKDKINIIKKLYLNNNNYNKKGNMTQRNNLSNNKHNEFFLTPKNIDLPKTLNANTTRKQNISNNDFLNSLKLIDNTIDNKMKTFSQINQISSAFLLPLKNIQKNNLLKNELNTLKINTRRNIKYLKLPRRNKSMINIKNNNNIDSNVEEKNNELEQILINGKKHCKHFGLEKNCPICVALQLKNKLLKEHNILPILKANFLIKKQKKIKKNKSNGHMINIKKIKLFGNEKNEIIYKKSTEEVIFPCIYEYFHNNKFEIV